MIIKRFLSSWKALAVAAFVAIALPSCSDDDLVLWDFRPDEIQLEISDADGNNLLDPAVENNIIGENITADYEGKTYDILWNTPYPNFKPESRMLLAVFYGLAHHTESVELAPSENNKWVITLGEFQHEDDYDVTVPVKIRDKVYNVRCVHKFWWKKKYKEPASSTTIYLDGKECEDGKVRIVL